MSMFTGKSVIAMTATAGVVIVGGAVWYKSDRTTAPQEVTETAIAQPVPDATSDPSVPQDTGVGTSEETTQPVAQVEEETAQAAPEATEPTPAAFDEVRREEDGMTIIAGRAEPGAQVQVLLDGEVITSTTADGGGKFAAITRIAPDGQGHILSLLQTVDGSSFASDDQIILTPIAPPVALAEAAPAAQEEAAEVPTEAAAPTAAATETATPEPAQDAPAPVIAEAPALAPVPDVETPQAAPNTAAPQVQTLAENAAPKPLETPQVTAPVEVADTSEPAPSVAQSAQALVSETTGDASLNIAPQIAEIAPETPNPLPLENKLAEASTTVPTSQASAPKPQVAVLKATEDGVELLNVPRPEALENIALDTISYSDAGDVQLSGRAQARARSVQVYLNNTSVVSLSVDEQGRWRGDLPDLDEGIYTLRVDEVAEDGSVTSRVETPFKREAPEVLAEAAAASDGLLKQITVQKGASLWAIAQDRYGDGLLYVNVFQANASVIRDPDLIYPGQVFVLPE